MTTALYSNAMSRLSSRYDDELTHADETLRDQVRAAKRQLEHDQDEAKASYDLAVTVARTEHREARRAARTRFFLDGKRLPEPHLSPLPAKSKHAVTSAPFMSGADKELAELAKLNGHVN